MTSPNWGGMVNQALGNLFGGATNWAQTQLFGGRGVAGQAMTPFQQGPGGAPALFDRPGFQIGGTQVNPSAILPGGAPFLSPAAHQGVAVRPTTVNRAHRRCPRGWVLAVDGNCYPKAMVPRKYRAWRPDPRPVFSRRDARAINRAHAARERLVTLTRKAGAHASLHRPSRRQAPRAQFVQGGRAPGTSIVNVD